MIGKAEGIATGRNAEDSISDVSERSLPQSDNRNSDSDSADNDDGCYCIMCVDHPRFENEQVYFEHYRIVHDKKTVENNQDSDDNANCNAKASVEDIMERLSKIKTKYQKFETKSNIFFQSVVAMQKENKLEPRFNKELDGDSNSIISNGLNTNSIIQRASLSKYKPATSVEEIMERLSQIKTEHQKFEVKSNSFIQSMVDFQTTQSGDNKITKGNPCLCSICPESPVFANEEEYFAHYRLVHEETKGTEKSSYNEIMALLKEENRKGDELYSNEKESSPGGSSSEGGLNDALQDVKMEKSVFNHKISGRMKIEDNVSNRSFKTESLTSLKNHYDAVKTKTDKLDTERESCIGSLQDLRRNGLTSIEKLVKREISSLESYKIEQNNLLEAIQKNIDFAKADRPDKIVPELNQRENMENNLKVSKWLRYQGVTTTEPSGNESKGIQANPNFTKSDMQASPNVVESGMPELNQRENMENNLKVSKWLRYQGVTTTEPSSNESKGIQANPNVTNSDMQASPNVVESGMPELNQRENMENNLKVSKWLRYQGVTTTEPSSNESKGIQANPNVTDSGMQASPNVVESGMQTSDEWVKEQESKIQLAKQIQDESVILQEQMITEKNRLSGLLQAKTATITVLEKELEQAKRFTSDAAAEFESSLSKAKHEATMELGSLADQSDKKYNTLVLEKEQVAVKLKERENQIKAFIKEIHDLQKFCKEIRSQSDESQKIYDHDIQTINEELSQKMSIVKDLEKEICNLKLGSKRIQDVNESLATRKHQLVKEINELKISLDKCKMEKDVFRSKFAEMEAQLAEKTKSFNEKIDGFLVVEKKYRTALKDSKSKLTDCEEQLRKTEEEINILKLQAQQVEQLNDELDKESKAKLDVSEKYIGLEKKYQALDQNFSRLKNRSTIDNEIHQSELESYRRETEKLKDSEFELTSRFDSLQKEHELCIKRKLDLERQFRQKESKLQTELETVLKESSSDYQNQIENLKEELRQLCSSQSTRQEMEFQLKKLTRENKEMADSLNQTMIEENVEKKRSVEQILKLEATVKCLNNDKHTLKSQLDFFQEKNEQYSQETKTKQEDFRDEVLYYKGEIANIRQTLQDQLKLCKQLQEERQDGGLPWQNEKKELGKELEKSKDKIKDTEIQSIIIQEKCSQLTRQLGSLKSQQTIDERKLNDKFEEEKRRIQHVEVEHANAIEVWAQKHTSVSRENEDLKQIVKELKLSRDVRMAKLETSEKMCRDDNECWRIKSREMILKNQRLEKQNREVSLLISTQEEQMRGLRKDNSNQSAHITQIEERLESLETVKLDLQTSNSQLKEKLQIIEKDYHRTKLTASQYSMYVHKTEKLEEENLKLKEDRDELTSAAGKFKDNVRTLESEHKALKKQCSLSEDIQHNLQQQNENLQLKLKNAVSSAYERLSVSKEELEQARFDYQQEIQEKKKRINTLSEQIRTLRQDLALTKAKQSDCENRSILEVQEELNKMTSIHENEIKIKLVTIKALKQENNILKEKIHNISEGAIGKYKNELNIMLTGQNEMKSTESQKISLQLRIDQLEQEISVLHRQTVEKTEVDNLTTSYVKDLKTRDQLIISLKTNVDALQKKLEEATSIENIENLLANHKLQIKSRDKTIFSLKEQETEASLCKKIDSLQNEVRKLESSSVTENQRKEMAERDEHIKTLEAKLAELEMSHLVSKEKFQTLITNKEIELDSRYQLILSQQKEIENFKQSTQQDKADDDDKIKRLSANHKAEIKSRDAEIKKLANQIAALEVEITSEEDQIKDYQKRLEESRKYTDETTKELKEKHNKEMKALELEKLEMKQKINDINAQCEQYQKELSKHEATQGEELKEKHNKEMKALELEKLEMKQKINDINARCEQYQKDLMKHEASYKEQVTRIKQLENDLQQSFYQQKKKIDAEKDTKTKSNKSLGNTGGNDNTWESSSSSSSSESDSDDDKVATTKKNKDTKEIARVSSISNKAKIESSTVRLEKNPGNLGKKTSQTNAITNLPVVDKSNARPPSNHHEPTTNVLTVERNSHQQQCGSGNPTAQTKPQQSIKTDSPKPLIHQDEDVQKRVSRSSIGEFWDSSSSSSESEDEETKKSQSIAKRFAAKSSVAAINKILDDSWDSDSENETTKPSTVPAATSRDRFNNLAKKSSSSDFDFDDTDVVGESKQNDDDDIDMILNGLGY